MAEPEEFTVVGHVESGAGIELRLDGEPYTLGGYEHFADLP